MGWRTTGKTAISAIRFGPGRLRPSPAPETAMLRPPDWLKTRTAAAALVGFALNIVAAIGATFYLDPAQEAEDAAGRGAISAAARSRMILAANAFDDMAMHTHALLFGVSLPPNPPDDMVATLHDLHLRALERRHDGVRGYLAELGVAGAIDYPTKLAEYEKLVAAEHANLTLETYRAANAFEGDLALAMVKAQSEAAMKAITLRGDRMKAKAVVAQRKQTLLAISFAGSAIVFLATMAGASKPSLPESDATRALKLTRRRLAARIQQRSPA
jgi:hypothetical protein